MDYQHQIQEQQDEIAGDGIDVGSGTGAGVGTGAAAAVAAAGAAAAAAAAATAAGSRPGLQAKPIRRRNRMINSCLECRKRKLKCSKTAPSCTNCIKNGRDCLYIGPRLDEASQMRLAEIKEKQGTLERQLERDVAKSTTPAGGGGGGKPKSTQQRILADEVEDVYDEERDLEATPLVALDLTYDDDADGGTDDMIDLGIQIGRMRITERIGGLSRPRLSEEISAAIPPQYGGLMGAYDDIPDGMSDASLPDFLKPGSQYIVPTSGLFFGQVAEPPSLLTFLPPRATADRLMTQYFMAVHPIAPCSHRPSLEAAYAAFWEEITAGFEPRASAQGIVFASMFSGLVSMDEDAVYHELGGYSKPHWVMSLKMGTETALSKANFLRTTKVETMQAFIIYMLPLCRAEVSRAHSVLVGAAVRMAECMGLHRDGEAYGLTPLETHVRRLVWHQLCFLDIRTCEAQGPKPVIRRDDYDTKLPLNVDDDVLTHAMAPPEPSDAWTSNTLSLIRFEINEMMRIIWLDRRRLEARRTTVTAVLTKIENFRRRMSEKYDHLLDVGQPVQRYAKCVMMLLTYRLLVMVLHPYHSNAANPMPAGLNNLLITSGIMVVELAIQLETNPTFRGWSWYLGAYFQYQIALLLATEVYFRPGCREAERIWSCLDYVFGMDRKHPPEGKGLQLLSEIQNRTAVYTRMRKMRGPSSLTRAMPTSNVVAGGAAAAERQAAAASSASAGDAGPLPNGWMTGHQYHGLQSYPPPSQQQAADRGAMLQPEYGSCDTKMEPGYGLQHSMQLLPPPPAPPQHNKMVFAGVSDGQALWSLPPMNHDSPGGSDTSSVVMGQHGAGGSSSLSGGGAGGAGGGAMPQGNIMDNIDWDTINTLFPSDPRTGGLSIHGYHDFNLGILDWSTQ
ncbi:hypothetical protein GGR56DRAFT_670803 [Xylariaceae sp. FL0804]|nr:hypothetical protein GGR56DRAFT_670803 [Xylariaceae sp. FL0804]